MNEIQIYNKISRLFIIESLTTQRKNELSKLHYFWKLYEPDKNIINKQILTCLYRPKMTHKNYNMLIWLYYKYYIHMVNWKDDMNISSNNFDIIHQHLHESIYFSINEKLISYIKEHSSFKEDACEYLNNYYYIFEIDNYFDYHQDEIIPIVLSMEIINLMEEKKYSKIDVAYELDVIKKPII